MLIRNPVARHPPFYFDDTSTTEIYPLSLHDALPIYGAQQFTGRDIDDVYSDYFRRVREMAASGLVDCLAHLDLVKIDRKSTRLNSSHVSISYAVFCLKKKKMHNNHLLLVGICYPVRA